MNLNASTADSLTSPTSTLSPLEREAAEYGADDLDVAAVLAELEEGQPEEEQPAEKPPAQAAKANGKPGKSDPFREELKRMPTAEVLQKLEAGEFVGHQAAEAVRAMQTRMNTVNVEFKSLKQQMRETLEELQQQRPGTSARTETPDPDAELLSRVTPAQEQLLEAMLRKGGYVRQDDLASQKTEEAAANFVSSAIEQGLEQYGDAFGFKDEEGQFRVNPDAQDLLTSTLDRLESSAQGVTPLDLFRLANFEQLLEQARVEERTKVQTELNGRQQQRAQRAIKGTVTQRSGSGNARPKLYDAHRDRGDTGKVIDRAWALLDARLSG